MDFRKKKQRGQNRRLKRLLKNLSQWQPFEDEYVEEIYDHFHVPSSPFIQHPKTRENIKKLFREQWVAKANELIEQKPDDLNFCKIVAIIIEPDLWCSQIIIFYDETYYNSFFSKAEGSQIWEEIPVFDNVPTSLNKRYFKETVYEEDVIVYQGTLKCFGDVWTLLGYNLSFLLIKNRKKKYENCRL